MYLSSYTNAIDVYSVTINNGLFVVSNWGAHTCRVTCGSDQTSGIHCTSDWVSRAVLKRWTEIRNARMHDYDYISIWGFILVLVGLTAVTEDRR